MEEKLKKIIDFLDHAISINEGFKIQTGIQPSRESMLEGRLEAYQHIREFVEVLARPQG